MDGSNRSKYSSVDFTFWGLYSRGTPIKTPINTIAYLVGLVDSPMNDIAEVGQAKFVLRYLFDVEEQVGSAADLITVQSKSCPPGYFPQTPVMLTLAWSPIAALLERSWEPVVLNREDKGMACASGIWLPKHVESSKALSDCETPEDLFWYVLKNAVEKATVRNLYISIVAKPGWSYESNKGRPNNLTFAEAEKADRIIWQRTA